ncbi:pentapeptide repeat-containing protein [Cyanobium gracile]|uniref:Pentapeptide repeat-containing protein n=1 Tax=Cyanobium gracile UHCC 0281 TaxID=3110309 RepID=A0ABU5SRM2_9CYAN|nr:pentapeptide repeat-containing protein [Cyanobium gracile]MEA5441164.1 pentapeptide repeat-containing protein [Cyanobium gracile UHCC 0281]
MRKANLQGAHLKGANFSRAIFGEVDLTGVLFQVADLRGMDLDPSASSFIERL